VSLLDVTDLRAGYGRIEALHGVSLHVDGGEAVTIIGSNGAGKTTLLRTVAGHIRPSAGRVVLAGEDITTWSPERRTRAGIGLVPEGRQVFAGLPVIDHLWLGAYTRRRDRAVRSDIEHMLELFPVLRERACQLAGTLSGGQQQLLVIGRALMSRPKVLLLDEPSLGLAPLAVREVVAKLVELVGDGTTLLLVEQNAKAAFEVAGRGYVLTRGEVVAEDSVAALEDDPRVQEAYLGGAGSSPVGRGAPPAPGR
jgi:branched-chain amino acid transport system ATP-binding protein